MCPNDFNGGWILAVSGPGRLMISAMFGATYDVLNSGALLYDWEPFVWRTADSSELTGFSQVNILEAMQWP
jgi:hypothetical protein